MAADALTISAGLQSLKAAFEIGKTLLNLSIAAQIRDRIGEMNEKILLAQEAAIASRDYQSALLKQIGELEKQIAELEAWDAEAETYQLTEVGKHGTVGRFAYAPKHGTHATEPPHLLCATCYQERHKSILQSLNLIPLCEVLVCNRCAAFIYVKGTPHPDHSKILPRR